MTEQPEKLELNPQITDITIGVRELRTITIYPLSFHDQEQCSDLLAQAFGAVVSAGEGTGDIEYVALAISMVKQNIAKILDLITDKNVKAKDLLKDITNEQAIAIAQTVYEVNFENLVKNVQSLYLKVKPVLPKEPESLQWERQSQQSVKSTEDTGSNTSTDSVIKTEE